MPQIKQFKKGSIIYFDGEIKTNFVYLLKEGVLVREKLSLETLAPERTVLQTGEFFGIKAALGVPVRDETIAVASDAVVYVFTPAEFEAFIKKNVSIIFKMLRAFSNELRKIHNAIEKMMARDSSDTAFVGNDYKLLSIGKYYQSRNQYSQAIYAYEKYLQHYPHGEKVAEVRSAIEQIRDIMAAKTAGEVEMPAEEEPPAVMGEEWQFVLFETPESYAPEPVTSPLHKDFSDFCAAWEARDFAQAVALGEKLAAATKDLATKDALTEKLSLGLVRLAFYQKQYDACIEGAKLFVKNYPKSAFLPWAMACIAESYTALGKPDVAKTVAQKIVATVRDENAEIRKAYQAKLAG